MEDRGAELGGRIGVPIDSAHDSLTGWVYRPPQHRSPGSDELLFFLHREKLTDPVGWEKMGHSPAPFPTCRFGGR